MGLRIEDLPPHVRARVQAAMRSDSSSPVTPVPTKRSGPWGKAIPTGVDGIRFPSQLEARVYQRLKIEAAATGARLYRQYRVALVNLAPNDKGKPLYLSVDFALVYPDNRMRLIDAKPKKWKSRDWLRGQKAAEALLGIEVELVDR